MTFDKGCNFDSLDCNCSRKKHDKCTDSCSCRKRHECKKTCKKDYYCKVEQQLLKDCICAEWTVPEGCTQTVFQTGGFEKIFGSGFVSFDCGESPYIIVQFLLNGNQVGSEINVFKDSCVAFTYTKFDSIKVTCPNYMPTNDGQVDNNVHECEGEIYINTRVPVRFN